MISTSNREEESNRVPRAGAQWVQKNVKIRTRYEKGRRRRAWRRAGGARNWVVTLGESTE